MNGLLFPKKATLKKRIGLPTPRGGCCVGRNWKFFVAILGTELRFRILPQPDWTTCGPTCLHAVYRYYGEKIDLRQVVRDTPQWERGGTLNVLLGLHALRRGYDATLYTYNLKVFDPSWFRNGRLATTDLERKLKKQAESKVSRKLRAATPAYLDFIKLGGEIRLCDLTHSLIRSLLKRGLPVLTGLNATYLYRCRREWGPHNRFDAIRGEPMGHFVVLCGYESRSRRVQVADPLQPNPVSSRRKYFVGIERLLCAILLGIVTYDGNLLVIQPKGWKASHGDLVGCK